MITKQNRELHIPIGLPGSGKTFDTPEHCLVVSKDPLRFTTLQKKKTNRDFWLDAEIGTNGSKNIEDVINLVTRQWFMSLLPYGYNIYLDCTNINCDDRKWYVDTAKLSNYSIHYILYTNHEEAIERNKLRKRTVPMSVVKKMMESVDSFADGELERCDTITVVRENNLRVKLK